MMRLLLLILTIVMLSASVVYAQDNNREQVCAEFIKLVQSEQFEEAKQYYISNKQILADNSGIEALTCWLYARLLTNDKDVNGALHYLDNSIRILDANYSELVSLKRFDFVIPYYDHAHISKIIDHPKAKERYLKAKRVFEETGFQSNDNYTQIINEITDFESLQEVEKINRIIESLDADMVQTDYKSALAKIEKSKAILEKIPTKKVQLLYASLYFLEGRVSYHMGNISNAEQAYLKALNYIDDTPESKERAIKIWIDLGVLYESVNDSMNAYTILHKAKQMYEEKGDLGPEYARCLGNLGVVSLNCGRILEASILIEAALDILSQVGPNIPLDIASFYASLIICYNEMGNKDEALDAAKRAQANLPKEGISPIYAQVYNNIGTVLQSQGDYEEARKAFESAVKQCGNSSMSSICHLNLAFVNYLRNDSKYVNNSIEFSKLLKDNVLSNFLFLSESQRFNYWNKTAGILNAYNRFIIEAVDNKGAETIYDNALFSKGLLLRMSNWVMGRIRESAIEGDKEKITLIENYKNAITSDSIANDSILYYQGEIMKLEKELMRSNITYSYLQKEFSITWKDVKQHLSRGEAAIEFLQVPIIGDSSSFIGNEYFALVIKKSSKIPTLIHICHEDSLSELLKEPEQLAQIYDESSRNEHYRSYLYGIGTYRFNIGTRSINIQTIGERLYDLIWSKIEDELKDISCVYYSPIGNLNSISFNALSQDSITLCKRYDLHLVSSTSEIALPRKKKAISDGLVYGGIRYDVDEQKLIAESRSYTKYNFVASRGLDLSNTDRAGWGFLSGTLEESQVVSSMLDSVGVSNKLVTDVSANEESFKAINGKSPGLIHIATHGFFLSNPKDIETKEFITCANLRVSENQQAMNAAGLLFAGGNRAWTGIGVVDGIEDGILTANEVSNMDLSNTDIVVLSACETGLGEDMSSEGVFGLQRAFKLAGVKTLVMSLWKVPDEATSKLMQIFYRNWLGGMDKHSAFKAAQLIIKQDYPQPYYWAGFVMLD